MAEIAQLEQEGTDPLKEKIAIADESQREVVEAAVAAFLEAEAVAAQLYKLQNDGDHERAVRVIETVLRREQDAVHQITDRTLSPVFERLTLGYNTRGMSALKEGKQEDALRILQKAIALTDKANQHMRTSQRLVLRAVTQNNLGCFYKSVGKMHSALKALRQCEKLESHPNCLAQNPAGTHLNLCALLSQMGSHDKALDHAQKAVTILRDQHKSGEAPVSDSSLVSVAYYNLGAEMEHLDHFPDALSAYRLAHQHAKEELGDDHQLTVQIANSIKSVQKLIKTSKK